MFGKFAYLCSLGYTVKLNWLSQMHVYLTNILLVKTTKYLFQIYNASEITNFKLGILTTLYFDRNLQYIN